jgi:hypothetical protein
MGSRLPESEQDASAPHGYPELAPAAIAAVNEKLIEIVSLRHGGRLTPEQIAELAAAVATQTANVEKLHRFPLRNSDEPCFIAPMAEAGQP